MDVDVAHDDRIVVVISREHKHKLLEYLLNERVRFDRDGRTPSVDPRRDETRRDATPPSDPAERPRRANERRDGTRRDRQTLKAALDTRRALVSTLNLTLYAICWFMTQRNGKC